MEATRTYIYIYIQLGIATNRQDFPFLGVEEERKAGLTIGTLESDKQATGTQHDSSWQIVCQFRTGKDKELSAKTPISGARDFVGSLGL